MFPSAHPDAGSSDLLASVVIPARDAGDALRSLIKSLREQTIPAARFEVIVGDDGSTDGSIDGIETRDGWVRVVRGPRISSDAARNRAARVARSPVLAFVDADCTPEQNWLEAGLVTLASADLAGGRICCRAPAETSVWTWLDMEFYDQQTAVRNGYAISANLFVRREAYERVGGFDDDLHYWGDYEFVARCIASGTTLEFSPNATVWHPGSNAWTAYLRKLWVINETYARYEAKAGRRTDVFSLRRWLPVLPVLHARRYHRKPLGLDTGHLQPRPIERLQAIPILYLLNPYLAATAKLYGWWSGRRLA
jgi:glycosyltransferase involved in cell wall biosynthesis